MGSLGRLLQPYVEVKWGDLELSNWDYGDQMKRPVVFNVSVDLETGDQVVNKASMEFDPSPVGFQAYVQCVGKATDPITITFGYEKGTKMETVYFFQNVEMSTGKEQKIVVNLAGLHKNKLTSHWWNEYIGNSKSEFTIKELFDSLAKKIKMKMEYTKGALEVIGKAPKLTHAEVVNTTLGGYMLKVAKDAGLRLEYPTGSKDDHEKIIVHTGGGNDPALAVSEKSIQKKVDVGSKRKDKRLGFLIGPTLVTSINRKTNPFAATDKDGDSSYDIRVTGSKAEYEEKNPVETSVPDQAAKPPSGATSAFDKEVASKCKDTKGRVYTGDKLKKCRAKISNELKKKAEGELSEMDTSVFMVPYMVGIRPYDFVVFPSLKGDYVEDWEVHSVSYKQEGGAVVVSINGKRPQVGQGVLLDEGSLSAFKSKAKSMKDLRDWENYYWNIT